MAEVEKNSIKSKIYWSNTVLKKRGGGKQSVVNGLIDWHKKKHVYYQKAAYTFYMGHYPHKWDALKILWVLEIDIHVWKLSLSLTKNKALQ